MSFALHCMTNQLSGALAAAATVNDHGVKVPILKALRLEVANGAAEIISTNTDQTVRSSIAADGSGVVHLDTLALAAKVRFLKQESPVAIEGDESAVTILQGRTRWKLPAIRNSAQFDFVAAAKRIEGEAIPIAFDPLMAALRACQPAFDAGDRYYLAGASVEWKKGALRIIGTDGHLAHVVQVPGDWPQMDSWLMPPEAVTALGKLYDADAQLSLIATADAFTFDDGDLLFKSKMIEGVFPDWRRIIPKSTGQTIVDAGEFAAAIERVSAIKENEGAAAAARFISVKLTFSPAEIMLTAMNRDGEEGEDYCAAEHTEGETEAVVNVSASLILTALRSFGPVDTIRISYSSEARKEGAPAPILIHRHAAKTDDFRLVNVLRG